MSNIYRLKGVDPAGTIFYLVVKSDVIKLINQRNEDISFNMVFNDAVACRFSLEEIRDKEPMQVTGVDDFAERTDLMLDILGMYSILKWERFSMRLPSTPKAPTEMETLRQRVTRKVSKEDFDNIVRVLNRVEGMMPGQFPRSTLALRFLEVCSVVPMDLASMAAWNHMQDIVHDVSGMVYNWDSERLEFKDCFSPRFAKDQP